MTDQILFIPGVSSPLAELKNLLFKQGQAGGIWVPSLSPTMISSESFGTGVQTFLDLSGNGKNATQASSGSRPAWGRVPKTGRRNLLVQSENASGGSWSFVNASGGASISGNDIVFGTSAVDRLLTSTVTISANTQMTGSVTLSGSGTVRLFLVDGSGSTYFVGTITLTSTPTRYSGSANLVNAGSGARMGIYNNSGAAASSFTLHNAQFETGSTATTYQKVTTAFDITESGQRDCYYLQPDGVDDGMATASIDLSGTDKVTVFAAVRKLSDAASGALIELSADPFNTNGAFGLSAPIATSTNGFRMRFRGTTQVTTDSLNLYPAPDNAVLTMQGDIGTDAQSLKRNGVQIASSTSSLGTGDFGNHPLYFFLRGGATVPFNGQCFGLIVAGGSYPLSTIQRVERILSRYTPGVSL